MTQIDETSVGKAFRGKDGNLWICISFCRQPTVTFERLRTSREMTTEDLSMSMVISDRVTAAVGSPAADGFRTIEDQ